MQQHYWSRSVRVRLRIETCATGSLHSSLDTTSDRSTLQCKCYIDIAQNLCRRRIVMFPDIMASKQTPSPGRGCAPEDKYTLGSLCGPLLLYASSKNDGSQRLAAQKDKKKGCYQRRHTSCFQIGVTLILVVLLLTPSELDDLDNLRGTPFVGTQQTSVHGLSSIYLLNRSPVSYCLWSQSRPHVPYHDLYHTRRCKYKIR